MFVFRGVIVKLEAITPTNGENKKSGTVTGLKFWTQHGKVHVSHEKILLLSIESWLFSRDPYKGLWYIIPI